MLLNVTYLSWACVPRGSGLILNALHENIHSSVKQHTWMPRYTLHRLSLVVLFPFPPPLGDWGGNKLPESLKPRIGQVFQQSSHQTCRSMHPSCGTLRLMVTLWTVSVDQFSCRMYSTVFCKLFIYTEFWVSKSKSNQRVKLQKCSRLRWTPTLMLTWDERSGDQQQSDSSSGCCDNDTCDRDPVWTEVVDGSTWRTEHRTHQQRAAGRFDPQRNETLHTYYIPTDMSVEIKHICEAESRTTQPRKTNLSRVSVGPQRWKKWDKNSVLSAGSLTDMKKTLGRLLHILNQYQQWCGEVKRDKEGYLAIGGWRASHILPIL